MHHVIRSMSFSFHSYDTCQVQQLHIVKSNIKTSPDYAILTRNCMPFSAINEHNILTRPAGRGQNSFYHRQVDTNFHNYLKYVLHTTIKTCCTLVHEFNIYIHNNSSSHISVFEFNICIQFL